MGFKLNNFYKKTNKKPSPLSNYGQKREVPNKLNPSGLIDKKKENLDLTKTRKAPNKLDPFGLFDLPLDPLTGAAKFGFDYFNPNKKKKNLAIPPLDGQKFIGPDFGELNIDNSGDEFTPELNDLISNRENLVKGTNEYLINQNKINELMGNEKRYQVDEPVNTESVIQSEPSDTVTSTITGEPVNVMDRGQMRAARRADRLERKEIRKGALTPGQARRLQKNKDVISRETRDRTKMGDVVQSVGSLFKKSPMNANKPVGAVGLDEVVVKASNKKSRVKHRLSKTRKKKNEATGAKKERLEKREQRLMKRRDKNTEKAAKDTSKGKKVYSKKEGKQKRGK